MSIRKIININRSWVFGPDQGEIPQIFSENMTCGSNWQRVTLPHTWNNIDGMIGKPYERGIFWYVRELTEEELSDLKQPQEGGRIYVEFGAAAFIADVYVNGEKMGSHVGGYSCFRVDITEALKESTGGQKPEKNILAVRVDNRYSEKYYPQMADFTFYGGLYRDVNLISVGRSHISLDDFGGSGVYVDAEPIFSGKETENKKEDCGTEIAVTAKAAETSEEAVTAKAADIAGVSVMAENQAKIQVKVLLDNSENLQSVRLQIIDADGKCAAEAYEEAKPETTIKTFLMNAEIWDGPKNPYLYKAVVSLISYNEVLDETEVVFGIRSFEIDKEKGFILNGKSHNLRGVSRHQDRLYLGNALTAAMCEEDADLIKEMGANSVRLAHYQQSHDMYSACDRRGLLVWAEIPYFAKSWDDDAHIAAVNEIRELVVQNYNHPSIFCWGLSNEVLMGQDSEKLIPCHEDLNAAVKAIDGKRYTAIAHEYTTPWDHKLHDISDIEGWNHYFGWYRGTTEDLGKWLDQYHGQYPDRRAAISEYGCDCVINYHSDQPQKMDYSEEYQAYLHEEALKDFAKRPYIWGTYVWNMFDFGSAIRHEGGTHGRNNKGLVTMDRKIKKDAFYVYKAWLSDDPFVHIDGRRYFARPGQTTTVTVRSNLKKVTLYVDGKCLDSKTGEHTFIFENVPITPEGTVLTAVSGECSDTISVRSSEEKQERFTNPDFKIAADAKNWFDNVEVVTDQLEVREGCYSVFDKVGDIRSNPQAKQVFVKCFIAVLDRYIDENRIYAGMDPEHTLAEATGEGFMLVLLGKSREKVLAAANAALIQIHK